MEDIRAYTGKGTDLEKLARYVESVFCPEDEILRQVREESEKLGVPQIHVAKMDGLHLETIARAAGACNAVEIGTMVGYSSICIARALGPTGKLYTFELESRYAEIARSNFVKAGVADRIEIFVGSALKNLPTISHQGPFDLVFIDADKERYPTYLKWAEDHLRVGGILLGDNSFAFGMVGDETIEDRGYQFLVERIREFNRLVAQGGRFRGTLLPTREGLTFAVKIR